MRKYFTLMGIAGGLALSVAAPAVAAVGPLSLGLSAGAQYDDNVTVDAQDLTTHMSDKAAIIEASAGYKFLNNKSLKLEANYDFYQSLHKSLTKFDLQIHGLSVSASTDLGGGVEVGVDGRYDHILLGKASFLDMSSIRPNVGFMMGPVRLIADYEYQYRNFKVLNTRDAKHHSFGVSAYFVPTSGTVLNAGYMLVRETAVGPEFDFWGNYFNVGAKVKVPLPLFAPTLRVSYRYYQKKFSNITPSIGVKRDDKRHQFKASVQVPIIAGLSSKLQYEYIKSISNLPSLDYPENVVTFSLGWAL